MTTPNETPEPYSGQSHEEDCPDRAERFGGHATCPEELTERQRQLVIAVSDLHSRVTTLWTWGLSQDEATMLMVEAHVMFLEENEKRVMKRRPPRVLPSVTRRNTQVVEEIADKDAKRKGPPPGVGS